MNRPVAALEQLLSEEIQNIYTQELEQELSQISCNLDDRVLVITLEGVITPPEQLLNRNNYVELVNRVRDELDRIIQPKIKNLIEQTIDIKITDFLCDTEIDTSRTGVIVIFEFQCREGSVNCSEISRYNSQVF